MNQVERLAEVLHETSRNDAQWQACVDCVREAERLFARGVRVVDVETLAAAVSKVQCGWEVEHRFAILSAVDGKSTANDDQVSHEEADR